MCHIGERLKDRSYKALQWGDISLAYADDLVIIAKSKEKL
jgi:hypothetical protein